MIELQQIRKSFPIDGKAVEVLKGIDLSIEKKEIFGIVGFSGAGKSTLLRCINFIEQPTSGEVVIEGVALSSLSKKQLLEKRKTIGMIFQHYNLLQSKTIFENIALPMRLGNYSTEQIQAKVTELLSFVGLEDHAQKYPSELSGGQKQRVGIARALVLEPSILLADEATSALDPTTTEQILELLLEVRDTYGVTIVLITHEMNVIRDICDRVALLEQGVILEQGTTMDLFMHPQSNSAKAFVRTVLNDGIPQFIQNDPSFQQKRIYRILFEGRSTTSPLLSDVAKQFEVDINILNGTITELQHTPFGNLIVEFVGDSKEVDRVIQFIESTDASIQEVNVQ